MIPEIYSNMNSLHVYSNTLQNTVSSGKAN